MSDRATAETFGRTGPWAGAPAVRSSPVPDPAPGPSAHPSFARGVAPSRLYVDGKRLVLDDPDSGQLDLPVAVVDEFAVEARPEPGSFEVVVRIEVRGEAEPLDAVTVASHVNAVLRAWQGVPAQDPSDARTVRGPALVPDGPEWIMLGPMADTRALADGELFAKTAGAPPAR